MVSAIIVAAGSSRRMGFDKLFAPLAGKPVLWHSIRAFQDTKDVDEILIVTRDDQTDEVEQLIEACLDLARTHGAASCASQIPDTVKRASIEQMVTESVERTGLWAMQTPQVFSSGLILQAYAALMAKHEMVTDEVSAVQKMGRKIALLKNDDWNLKVTFPHDLELAEHVLELRAKKTAKSPKPRAISR